MMRIKPAEMDGAFIIDLEPILDTRGFFARTFCAHEFAERGLNTCFQQHSTSFNARRATLRGLHLQLPPHEEAKVVSCRSGAIYDVIVDVRPGSPTFMRWQGVVLSAENLTQLYIPEGVAHGFQTLVDDTQVDYMITAFQAPEAAIGFRWDDPALDISWPLPPSIMSERDQNWKPLLPENDKFR